MRLRASSAIVLITALTVCCQDGSSGPSVETTANLARYVAMGTSISMGWTSDGVLDASQQGSWPAKLAAEAGASFTLPLIASPGCRPPLAAPLQGFLRIDASPVTTRNVCSSNSPGVALPTQNVSIAGITAAAAVGSSTTTNLIAASRVLPVGMTEVSAMRAQNPTFVSVEFGANEALNAMTGLLLPGVTIFTDSTFATSYSGIIDSVKATGAQAVLVLLPSDVRKLPVVRTAQEIAGQRAAFAAHNITVNADCDTSTNMVSLIDKVLVTVRTAALRAGAGLGPTDLSCADVPGVIDGILTSSDIATINGVISAMNALITQKAEQNGYALFSLGAIADGAKDSLPFDLNQLLTSSAPFGPLFGLDGLHPSAAGNASLEAAAKTAITQKYGRLSTH